jgi:hypothetical protein
MREGSSRSITDRYPMMSTLKWYGAASRNQFIEPLTAYIASLAGMGCR